MFFVVWKSSKKQTRLAPGVYAFTTQAAVLPESDAGSGSVKSSSGLLGLCYC